MSDWELSIGSLWFVPAEMTISTDPDTPIYNQMSAMAALTGRINKINEWLPRHPD